MKKYRKSTQQIFEDLDQDDTCDTVFTARKEKDGQLSPWISNGCKSYVKTAAHSKKSLINQLYASSVRQKKLSITKKTVNNIPSPVSKKVSPSETTHNFFRRKAHSVDRISNPSHQTPLLTKFFDFNKKQIPNVPSFDSFRSKNNSSNLLSFLYRKRQPTQQQQPTRYVISVKGKHLKQRRRNIRIAYPEL